MTTKQAYQNWKSSDEVVLMEESRMETIANVWAGLALVMLSGLAFCGLAFLG